MKKLTVILLTVILVSIDSFSQFKIMSNGEARLWTNNMGPYDNSMITYANNDLSKAYIVDRNGIQKFLVEGRGRCFSTGFYTMSDSTLKYEILPIDNALSKVMKLNGVTYYFKNDEIPQRHIEDHNLNNSFSDSATSFQSSGNSSLNIPKKNMGLIAQNVEIYVPEAIDSLENGKLAISYDAMVGLLIESIKEQQTQIQQLQSDVFSQEQYLLKLKLAYDSCCSSVSKKSSIINSSENTTTRINEEVNSFESAKLYENIPNPFTTDTKIEFYIPDGSTSIRLIIHDLQGLEIKSFYITQTGRSNITLNSSELKAGMYLYTLLIDNKIIDTKRMLLTKD